MPSSGIKLPPIVLSDSKDWIEFRDGDRTFYADPLMARHGSGDPVLYFDFYKSYLILQRLGLRAPTDLEYHIMLNNPGIAKAMKTHKIVTGFVRKVEKKGERYIGRYIERPVVRGNSYDNFEVVGSEREVDLPDTGWFKIRELLECGEPFPHETLPKYPYPFTPGQKSDDPFAFFCVYKGDLDVVRGPSFSGLCARVAEDCMYDITIGGRVAGSHNCSILAVSDERPNIQADKLKALAEKHTAIEDMLFLLDELEEKHKEALEQIEQIREGIRRYQD